MKFSVEEGEMKDEGGSTVCLVAEVCDFISRFNSDSSLFYDLNSKISYEFGSGRI